MPQRKILFIHQNFPAQFVHVAAELARLGHVVVALCVRTDRHLLPGVRTIRYRLEPPTRASAVDAARDFETKIVRGLACARAMEQLKANIQNKKNLNELLRFLKI